jgi:transposase
VQYGRRFKAFCLYLLNYQLLPYERTGELLATLFGYQPGGGTLQSILDQAYGTLEPIETGAQRGHPSCAGRPRG